MAQKMWFGFLDQADNPGPPGYASILLPPCPPLIYYSLSSFPLLNIKSNRTLSLPAKVLASSLGFQPSTVLSPWVKSTLLLCSGLSFFHFLMWLLVPVVNIIPTALFIRKILAIDKIL